MRVYFHSTNHPCPENAMNMNMLKRWYAGNEWSLCADPSVADMIIVATCGFSKQEEDREIAVIEELLRAKKAGCELVITGCLPKINRDRVRGVFDGRCVEVENMRAFDEITGFERSIGEFENHFVSEHEYDTDPQIHRYFKARNWFERYSFLPFVRVPKILYTVPSERWFFIRCAMGCTGNCTYCGIKHAHGGIKSDSIDSILAQVTRATELGYREISLTGEDQGGYGQDQKTDLPTLLDAILRLPGDFKVNLRYIDPYWLIKLYDRLLPIFQTGRITAFCSPVQSGSDRILKAMNRRYSFREVKSTVNGLLADSGLGLISTNIIVGFPGETEDDFTQSLRLLDEVGFGMYMAFKYEDRPGTMASRYSNKVPEEVIDARYKRMMTAIRRKHRKFSLRMR